MPRPTFLQIALEPWKPVGRDDGTDIAIRPHQHPGTGCHGMSIAKTSVQSIGLVQRQAGSDDRRVHEAVVEFADQIGSGR